MFILPSKYTEKSPLFKCVDRIKNFHPNEKILIIDSNSYDKSHFSKLEKIDDVEIYDAKNVHYEIGALWYVYENKLNEGDENFYLMHDSMLLNRNLDLMKNFEFCAFTHHKPCDGGMQNYFKQNIPTKSEYKVMTSSYFMVFGSCFFSKKSFLDKLYKKGANNILPTDKFGSGCMERIIGQLATQEGINVANNSLIPQDNLSENGVTYLENGCMVHSNRFYDKVFGGRQ